MVSTFDLLKTLRHAFERLILGEIVEKRGFEPPTDASADSRSRDEAGHKRNQNKQENSQDRHDADAGDFPDLVEVKAARNRLYRFDDETQRVAQSGQQDADRHQKHDTADYRRFRNPF